MKRGIFLATMFVLMAALAGIMPAQAALIDDVRGRILLQVEANGEAWYVNPETDRLHFLGRPIDALQLMQQIGLGISNENLDKLKGEGVHESAPDEALSRQLSGKILLQVEDKGQAWYIWPENNERYFLGSPADAFRAFRELGLGISNANFARLQVSEDYTESEALVALAEKAIANPQDPEVQSAVEDGRLKLMTSGDIRVYSFTTTSPLSTEKYEYMGKGTYYAEAEMGIMTKKAYQQSSLFLELEGESVSQMIISEMNRIQAGLEAYRAAIAGYPLSGEQGDTIGISGRTMLTNPNGFFGTSADAEVYVQFDLPKLEGHSYVYHSRGEGKSYEISIYLPADIEGFTSGEYLVTPTGIHALVACTLEFAPVCGADGITYGNSCMATQQYHVEIQHEGECEA